MAHDGLSSGVASGLHYLHAGAGRPLVLIHGWPTGGGVWAEQLRSLSAVAHVYAPDLPGYGDTPASGVTSLAGMALAIRNFLEELDLEEAVIVGWSLGGGVVMSYLEQFGTERIAAAGIVDDCPCLLPAVGWELGTHTTFDPSLVEGWVAAWHDDRESVIHELSVMEFCEPAKHESEIRRLDSLSLRADPEAALAGLQDAFACDFRDSLSRVAVPVLLMYGGRSGLTTQTAREFMLAAIPSASLHVFERSGHNPFIEQQREFDDALTIFVREIWGSPNVDTDTDGRSPSKGS